MQKNTGIGFGAVGNWLETAAQTWAELGKNGEMPRTKEFATILAEKHREIFLFLCDLCVLCGEDSFNRSDDDAQIVD